MEPCAPGTEDDLPIMYSTLNKQETETERLLKQKAFLRNGKYDTVFELTVQNGMEHWYCKACECPVMGRVFQHEAGRRHTLKIASTHHNVENFRRGSSPEENVSVEVAPGEPLPPGFEDISRVSQIQERLDGFKVGPLIALEYLLELQDDDASKEPFYLCILCDKRGDPRTVLTHLSSYNHISQYLQKHFPTCWRALAPYNTKQYRRNWQTTLQKIAEGIEKKFGRLKPFPIEKDKFDKDRMHYLQIVGKGRHFSETSGYTFEELIVHDELTKNHDGEEKTFESSSSNNWGSSTFIQKPFKKRSPSPPVVVMPSKRNKGNAQTNPRKAQAQIPAYSVMSDQNPTKSSAPLKQEQQNTQTKTIRRRSLSSLSSISDKSNESDDNRQRYGRVPIQRKAALERERQLPYGRRRSISPRRRSPFRRRSPSPKRRSPSPRRRFSPKRRSRSPPTRRRSQSPSVLAEQEKEKLRKVEEFRKLARAIENDMHKTLKQHEKNPEKHPQYNEEWKKFWNKRYKELKTEGVDVQKYDFKPEWIQFWNKRMVELHSDELRNRKEALRKRLGLPTEISPIVFKIGNSSVPLPEKINPKPLPMAAQPDQDNEIIVIDDKDEDKLKQRKGVVVQRSGRRRSTSLTKVIQKSRDRSPVRNSRDRSKTRYSRHSRSKSRSRSRDRLYRSSSRDKNRTKNSSPQSETSRRSKETSRSRDRDYGNSKDRSRSRSRGSPAFSRRIKERRSVSRERSREKRDYRESSFERDLRERERIRTVADLPWQRDGSTSFRNPYLPPPVMRDVSRKPIDMSAGIPDDDDEETEVNIVDVLRLLTALEERLGSLGPKVIDLLAQALAMEKSEANSSDNLLNNEINCVLFETVKEKLKGQLFAGLVDIVQQRAFKKAIKKIASLMHMAGQRKRTRDKVHPKALPVAGVGTVDKAAIAKQIANALIAQGKTDVTQTELEQLINAVVKMAEASKGTGKPMTTAHFLQTVGSNTEKQTQDKIIIPSSAKKSEVTDIDKLTEPLTPSPGKNSTSNMENLSDSDLQTLLQNFKDLSTEEQHNLINYLKKLEYQEPERVEKLRKFVNLESGGGSKSNDDHEFSEKKSRESPFSNRLGGVNPDVGDLVDIDSDEEIDKDIENDNKNDKDLTEKERKVHIDSEDEYTFEDVVKTVSKNVKDKEMEQSKKLLEETMKYDKSKSISSAKDLISDLMGNITKNTTTNSNNIDLLGLGKGSTVLDPQTSVANVDFTKISDINIASLTSIVNNVKSMTATSTTDTISMGSRPGPKLNFDLGQLNKPQSPVKDKTNLEMGGGFNRGIVNLNLLDKSSEKFDRGFEHERGFTLDTNRGYTEHERVGGQGFDRFGSDRFGAPSGGGTNRFETGQDRFVGTDNRFGPNVSERFGGGPDRFHQERFMGGQGGFENFSGPDRGFNDRGFGASDRGFGGPARGTGNGDQGYMDRGARGPGVGAFRGTVPHKDLIGQGNFNHPPGPFRNDLLPRPPLRPGGNDQRNFPRMQGPAGNFNRW